MSDKDKLAICIIGHGNSGKSTTLYSLFGGQVNRGKHERELKIFDDENNSLELYVNVFIVNGSPQESNKLIESMLPIPLPKILICSLQYAEGRDYVEDLFGSLNWLENNRYKIFAMWLNPDFDQPYPYYDSIGLASRIHKNQENIICIRSANQDPDIRAQEIKEYVHGWASARNLTY